MRILYVEDNIPNVLLVQRIASIGHHDVISYPQGEQAIDSFEQDKPDLVLMDIQLQGKLNGLEVVRILRAKGFATPIIALTAYAMGGDRQRCLEAGCDDYVPKPVSVTELIEIFSRYQSRIPTQIAVEDGIPPPPTPPDLTKEASNSLAAELQPSPEKLNGLSTAAEPPESPAESPPP